MNPTATQRAVQIPRNPWWFRCSREAPLARPINIATNPIGSIATKIGMKARKNFWIIVARVPKCRSPQMNTDETEIHQNSFSHL